MANSIIVVKACVVRHPFLPPKAFAAGEIVQPYSKYYKPLLYSGLATDSGEPAIVVPEEQPYTAVTLQGGRAALPNYLADLSNTDNEFSTALKATFERPGRPVGMNMQTYESATARGVRVLFMESITVLYGSRDDLTMVKSTDGGATWTEPGVTLAQFDGIYKLSTGTLLLWSNSGKKLYRSTDDGATKSEVKSLTDRILGSQGVLEMPDGSILQGDYGTTTGVEYKIWRSTDDGQTWTVVFTPTLTGAATQVHNLVWDPIEGCALTMIDGAPPRHYRSDDNGVTWTLVGESLDQIDPNWVAPMFFDNYIAWGYDSELGGKIARISRANFYAGNWNSGTIEEIAHVDGKAWYWTFPVRPGVWIVALADEVVAEGWGGNDKETGSWAQEVYIVSDDGAKVFGGVSWAHPYTVPGTVSTNKIRFAAYPRMVPDFEGITWLTVLPQDGRVYSSIPASVGWGDPLHQIEVGRVSDLILESGEQVYAKTPDGSLMDILQFDSSGRLILRNRYPDRVLGNPLPEIRLAQTGTIDLQITGAIVMQIRNGGIVRLLPAAYLEYGSGGPRDGAGAGSPEGVKAWPVGSTWRRSDGVAGATYYVKESGGSTATGWVAK